MSGKVSHQISPAGLCCQNVPIAAKIAELSVRKKVLVRPRRALILSAIST